MLKELFEELQAVYESSNQGEVATSAFALAPKSTKSVTTVFVNRDGGCLWYTLNSNDDKEPIPSDHCLYGTVTGVANAWSTPANPKYPPSLKLKVYVTGIDNNAYMIYCGMETAFGKGLVKSLNAFSTSELKETLALGVKASEQDEKVVFAQVSKADGSYRKSDQETPLDAQYSSLCVKLGQPSTGFENEVPSVAPPSKVSVAPVVDYDGDEIPF